MAELAWDDWGPMEKIWTLGGIKICIFFNLCSYRKKIFKKNPKAGGNPPLNIAPPLVLRPRLERRTLRQIFAVNKYDSPWRTEPHAEDVPEHQDRFLTTGNDCIFKNIAPSLYACRRKFKEEIKWLTFRAKRKEYHWLENWVKAFVWVNRLIILPCMQWSTCCCCCCILPLLS